MSETVRAFVAVKLGAEMQEALRRIQADLQRQVARETCRWVRPEDIHLTLKFLGDVPQTDVPEIVEVIRAICAQHQPFDLALAQVGCFPNHRQPRVVWAGVGGDVALLAALQKEIEEALSDLGYEPEERGFSPHLTLARTARNASPAQVAALGQQLQRARHREDAIAHVDKVYLMRSDLHPSGPIYTALAMAELRKEA